MTRHAIPTLKLRMLVPRVVYGQQRGVGDEIFVQQPLADLMIDAKRAELATTAKKPAKKDA